MKSTFYSHPPVLRMTDGTLHPEGSADWAEAVRTGELVDVTTLEGTRQIYILAEAPIRKTGR